MRMIFNAIRLAILSDARQTMAIPDAIYTAKVIVVLAALKDGQTNKKLYRGVCVRVCEFNIYENDQTLHLRRKLLIMPCIF